MIAFIKQFMFLFMNCLFILAKIAKSLASIAETWLEILNAGKTFNGNGNVKTLTGNDLPNKNVAPDGDYPTFLSQLFATDGFFKIVCEGNILTMPMAISSWRIPRARMR